MWIMMLPCLFFISRKLAAILAPTTGAVDSNAYALEQDTGSTRKYDYQTGHQYLKQQICSVGAKNKTRGVTLFDDFSSALNFYF